jgi:hypothetical protein
MESTLGYSNVKLTFLSFYVDSVVFTLFVFGALTYITVKQGSDPVDGGHIAGSRLTHRLLSEPLDSDDENQSENVSSASALEIDHNIPPAGPHLGNERNQYPPRPEWMN